MTEVRGGDGMGPVGSSVGRYGSDGVGGGNGLNNLLTNGHMRGRIGHTKRRFGDTASEHGEDQR